MVLDRAAEWMENDLPALEAADLIDAALEARADAAYFGDRDYPIAAEWADGANPYARANPDAPWVHRALPLGSCSCGWTGVPRSSWAMSACRTTSRLPSRPVRSRRAGWSGSSERIGWRSRPCRTRTLRYNESGPKSTGATNGRPLGPRGLLIVGANADAPP